MPFDDSTISNPKSTLQGRNLLVSWSSSSPAGTVFQVYVGGRLAWHGTQTSCLLPHPGPSRTRICVGAVGVGEDAVDFSASLPAAPWASRARLTWFGGTYQSDSIQGFHVYQGPTAGAAIDYTTPVATVTAYPQGRIIDGAGRGPAGRGGAGRTASSYSWTSESLAPGAWNFGIKPFDTAGNEGAADEETVTIAAPPRPPARDAVKGRLWLAGYDPSTKVATLAWHPSPS